MTAAELDRIAGHVGRVVAVATVCYFGAHLAAVEPNTGLRFVMGGITLILAAVVGWVLEPLEGHRD